MPLLLALFVNYESDIFTIFARNNVFDDYFSTSFQEKFFGVNRLWPSIAGYYVIFFEFFF